MGETEESSGGIVLPKWSQGILISLITGLITWGFTINQKAQQLEQAQVEIRALNEEIKQINTHLNSTDRDVIGIQRDVKYNSRNIEILEEGGGHYDSDNPINRRPRY